MLEVVDPIVEIDKNKKTKLALAISIAITIVTIFAFLIITFLYLESKSTLKEISTKNYKNNLEIQKTTPQNDKVIETTEPVTNQDLDYFNKEIADLNYKMPFYIDLKNVVTGKTILVMGDSIDDSIIMTFEYPSTWERSNSIFIENEKKVAEYYFKPIVTDQECILEEEFDNYQGRVTFISQELVNFGELAGTYKITSLIPEGSKDSPPPRWYPNSYCLKNSEHGIGITFYEYSQIPVNQELYEEILNSVYIY